MRKILLLSLIALAFINTSYAEDTTMTVVADGVTNNGGNLTIGEAGHETLAKGVTVGEGENKTIVNDDCKNNPECRVSAGGGKVVTPSLGEGTKVDGDIPLNSAANKNPEDILGSANRLPQTGPEHVFLLIFALIIGGLFLRKEKMFNKI